MTTGGKIERYYRVWKLIYLMSKSLAKFGPIEIQVFYRKLLQATPNCVGRMVKWLDAPKYKVNLLLSKKYCEQHSEQMHHIV